jgi:hypothetical protein
LIAIVLIVLIVKPVYDSMYEDVFLRIGGNRNLWGNHNIIFNFSSEVYKYYTLSQSFIKLDLMINVEFLITMFFVMYGQGNLINNDTDNSYFIGMLSFDVLFSLLVIFVSILGYLLVRYTMNFYTTYLD